MESLASLTLTVNTLGRKETLNIGLSDAGYFLINSILVL